MDHLSRIGEPFITLSEVDSTNNYAMARIAEAPVAHGTTWFAWKQTAGKGQRGHRWMSAAGENILMSIVLKPSGLQASNQFYLSAVVALALHDLIKKYAPDQAKIKWSNDIYLDDKKAGGILIENILRGNEWHYAVVGIGLNVNQETFPRDLPNPVSLRQFTGQPHEVLPLAGALCQHVAERFASLRPGNFNTILAEYTRALYGLNRMQRFQRGEETFEAVIRGVDSQGKLQLQKGAQIFGVDFGEVIFLRQDHTPIL
jgi:BirA family biotin operon repressor/biotin-[acetyl-CoA-carboxylase] ligase